MPLANQFDRTAGSCLDTRREVPAGQELKSFRCTIEQVLDLLKLMVYVSKPLLLLLKLRDFS